MITALLVALAIVASLPELAPGLAWDPARVAAEPWRFVTAHATHFSLAHAASNIAAFALLGRYVERRGRARFVALVSASVVSISLVLALLGQAVGEFRGASAVVATLAVAAGLLAARAEPEGASRWRPALLSCAGFALVAKGIFELAFAQAGAAGVTAAPFAHALGALVGSFAVSRPTCGREPSSPGAHARTRLRPELG